MTLKARCLQLAAKASHEADEERKLHIKLATVLPYNDKTLVLMRARIARLDRISNWYMNAAKAAPATRAKLIREGWEPQ